MRSRHPVLGLVFVVLSSAAFGTSGTVGKSLIHTGWSPAAVVTWRVALGALCMLPLVVAGLRGRTHLLRANLGTVLAFGLIAVAGCQLAYFNAVEHLSVGVALLLEYLGIVLVVLWMWLRHGRRPHRLTLAGVALAVVGLLLVLDVLAGFTVSGVGVVWGLVAAVGLAAYYVISSHEHEESLPPVVLAGLALAVGAVALGALCLVGVLPYATGSAPVVLAGTALPWWVAIAELGVVAAAVAYATGIVGARLTGATVASFVGLSEVVFAIGFAWLLLGELPTAVQLAGAVLMLAGVVAVRAGEVGRGGPEPGTEAEAVVQLGSHAGSGVDFPDRAPVA